MRPLGFLGVLFLLSAAVSAQVANPAISALFPDCPECAEPGPQPLQISALEAPAGYRPGDRYEVVLHVTPHHGLVSRFNLSVDRGSLASDDPNVRVVNSTTLGHATPFVGGKAAWRFVWTAPPAGSGNATFTVTTMSGFGDGIMGRDAWFTRRVVVVEGPAPTATPRQPGLDAAMAAGALAGVAGLRWRRRG